MKFNLKFNDIDEERNLNDNYSIKNLFDDLSVSSQTIVAKQNGEIAVVLQFDNGLQGLRGMLLPLLEVHYLVLIVHRGQIGVLCRHCQSGQYNGKKNNDFLHSIVIYCCFIIC